jgi:predicted transcriptional regulator
MEVLWDRGASTVSEVVGSLREDLAYSTVLTTLRILENKGYVRHVKEGRAFIYRPVVGREQARGRALAHLLRRFFENTPELLMLKLMEKENIGIEELNRLKKRIEEEET